MSISAFDSAIYRDLFTDRDVAKLFTDSAEIRAMMIVEGALAKAQGALGMIPETAAKAIHRASMELQIDPSGLAQETGQNGVPVPALVAAFRKAMEAPDHAAYLHWGATSQDIIDTALMLRLRQATSLIEARLDDILSGLASLARTHADTPMAARSYGQIAAPSAFGALVASWGRPLLRHKARLNTLSEEFFTLSLSGAAGTSAVWGAQTPALRAEVAKALGLRDPGHSWHAERDGMAEFASLLSGLLGSLGKMGTDLILLTRSELAELRLPKAGGSSTMPQKQNPVAASALVALARHGQAMAHVMQGAALHAEARDGVAWFTEWLSLPPLVMAAAKSAAISAELAQGMTPDTDAMAARLADPLGLIRAEGLSFALAAHMPRPEAQAAIKTLCKTAQETGRALPDLVAEAHPEIADAAQAPITALLGQAPAEARGFADDVTKALSRTKA